MALDVNRLYRIYGPMVLRRCRYLLHDEEAALDAMQETFVLVLRKQEALTGDAPSSMLYTFATNVCLNQLRTNRRRHCYADSEAVERVPSSDDPEERALCGHFLQRLLRTEDGTTARILRLLFVEKRTLNETAAAVRLSVSGIRQRINSLRRRALVLRDL